MSLPRLNDYQLALWQQSQIQDKEPLGQYLWGYELPFLLSVEEAQAKVQRLLSEGGDLHSKMVAEGEAWHSIPATEPWFIYHEEVVNTEEASETSLAEVCQDYAEHIFQLDKPSLCRFILIHTSSNKSILLFHFHVVLLNPFQAQKLLMTLAERLNHTETTEALVDDTKLSHEKNISPSSKQTLDLAWDNQENRLACIPDLKAFQYFEFNLNFVSPLKNPLKHHRSASCSIPWQRHAPQLEMFAKQAGTDVEKVLMAACLVAISRFTHKKRFVIGYSPVERMVMKAIPALFQSQPQSSFLAFVQDFHRRIVADIRQETTLYQLQEALKAQGGAASQRHVNVLWQQMPEMHRSFSACRGQALDPLGLWIGHHLEFHYQPSTQKLRLHYRRGVFHKAWAKSFVEQVLLILEQGVYQPHLALCKQHLSKNETIAPFLARNHPAHIQSRETLLSLIERAVRQYPNKVALRVGEHQLTYSEIECQAEKIAGIIQQQYQSYYGETMPRQVMIGIACAPNVQMYLCLLAVLKCAGIFVLIDQNFPVKRVKHIIKNADIKVLIGDSAWTHGKVMPKMCYLDETTFEKCSPQGRQITHGLQKTDFAYGIYTSGSTGFPKGVLISHQQIVSYLLAMKEKLGLDASVSTLSVTHCSFDMFISDVFLTWGMGGTHHYAHEMVSHPKLLAKELQKNDVNLMFATPTVWCLLVQDLKPMKHACHLLVGGETLSSDLAKRLLKISAQVWNIYGTTETTIVNTIHRVQEDNLTAIGSALANSHISILDRYYRQVPPFMPGNLYVSGQAVGEGYIHQRDGYHQFAIHTLSFGDQPLDQVWCFATRDRVYTDKEGAVYFLNRADQQYKLRGFRIEVEEVAELVKRHPRIEQVKAVIQPLQQQIIVYYTTKPQSWLQRLIGRQKPVTHLSLQTFAEKYLPHYMLPSAWVEIPTIPTDYAGKFDQKALPKPSKNDFVVHENEMIPNDHLEATLRVLWKKVLGLEQIGMEQNFFHIGGYSIRAIQLISLVNQALAVEFPAAWIYHHPTIRSQAHQLRMIKDKTDTHQSVIVFKEKKHYQLFMIHPGWVGSECYEHFIEHLPDEFGGIGLDLLNLGGTSLVAFDSLEEYAAHYVKKIKEIQPQGPYYIGGWSLGGYVAYAVAQQLQRQGANIAGLYMLDVQRFRSGGSEQLLNQLYPDKQPDNRSEEKSKEPRLLRHIRQLPPSCRTKFQESHAKIIEWCEQYNIQPYNGRVLFFWALRNRFSAECAIPEPNYGWYRWVEELTVLTIDGDHFDLLEPGYAEHLAERVGHDMKKALEVALDV